MMVPFDGRTRVLAFVRDWRPDADELHAIRAELRGLGAVLVILSNAGAWSFQPDDDLERFDAASELPAMLAERFEVDGDAVLVIDGAERVRFAHAGPLHGSLLDALVAAGQALATPAPIAFVLNRRELVIASLCTGFALVLLGCGGKKQEPPKTAPPAEAKVPPPVEYDIVLDINGQKRALKVDARVSLLDALRERLALPGTKKGCDHGQCGACTVHADDRRVNACLMLAVACEGKKIVTIEGLAQGDDLHPMQKAFVEHDGFQCGYCTPGQIMSAVALLAEGKAKTDDEVRELMSGNICRCGAYPNIVAAVQAARRA
jgi:xanthine dehydrogenase YagT iron-sulfur-binding subunit